MHLEPQQHTRAGVDMAWASLGAPGTWFSGAEKLALAAETRAAHGCALCAERVAALFPYAVEGDHAPSSGLSAAALDAVHRISTDPGRLSQRWYHAALESGLTPEQVVELTGVVGVVTIADSLAVALGAPLRSLPEPQPGEPSRKLVSGTEIAGGWVPKVRQQFGLVLCGLRKPLF